MFALIRTGTIPVLMTMGCLTAQAQQEAPVTLTVSNGGVPLPRATVELVAQQDSSLVKISVTDASGQVQFAPPPGRSYFLRVSHAGFAPAYTAPFTPGTPQRFSLALQPSRNELSGVTVVARKPFLEQKPGKTIVNLEASITAVGSTVSEALERLPNVTVDRNGGITLKGRPGVNVYIDGKPTNLSGTELATMLQGMSASGIERIELLDQPPARYEAAGGAGIINLITKKSRQKGFNGSLTAGFTQGIELRTNNSANLAWRRDKWSVNATYSVNAGRNVTYIDASRTYFDNQAPRSVLEQESVDRARSTGHNLRSFIEYAATRRTTFSLTLNGLLLDRQAPSNNYGTWRNPQGQPDSTIHTSSISTGKRHNAGVAIGMRHAFNANHEWSVDAEGQWYRMRGSQYFNNSTAVYNDQLRSYSPGRLGIVSLRTDYTARTKEMRYEAGARVARIVTDNEVSFDHDDGTGWKPDLLRSNHFQYEERIWAAYGSAEWKKGRWTTQGGLRFEATDYDAHQLGNAQVKDSSFSRAYQSLFPTVLVSFEADSSHTWNFSAGRRIDRPPFQKLNPFSYVINRYTVQRGNPYFRPQFSWNLELGHTYKGWLTTSVGYSITTDYFAQLFPVENGIVVYTEGNLGQLQVFSLNLGAQRSLSKWWNVNASALVQHKVQEGFVESAYKAEITQATFNLNNQFRFAKGWGAELSGIYITRSQNDIQEILDPSGQLSIGISKTVLHGAGTLRLAGRDLFYTQWIKGNTVFRGVTEWFKLSRDTRVAALSFTWRFGKTFKTTRRSSTPSEEVQRAGG